MLNVSTWCFIPLRSSLVCVSHPKQLVSDENQHRDEEVARRQKDIGRYAGGELKQLLTDIDVDA
jgi:hypothetical protein